MKKKGFALLELLIYLVLSSIFFLLLFQFTVQILGYYNDLKFATTNKYHVYNCIDLLTRDLRQASNNLSDYKMMPDNFIFKINDKDIYWYLKDSKVFRIEGQYNTNGKIWLNKTESLVCSDIENFKIYINQVLIDKSIKISSNSVKIFSINITAKFKDKLYKIEKTVCPNSGMLFVN